MSVRCCASSIKRLQLTGLRTSELTHQPAADLPARYPSYYSEKETRVSKKQKLRYLLAVYLVVALAAIILGLIAFNQKNVTWQALLLNLSTELLGVVLVFLLVNILFLLGDWDLSDQVKELVQTLKNPSARDLVYTRKLRHTVKPHDLNVQTAQGRHS